MRWPNLSVFALQWNICFSHRLLFVLLSMLSEACQGKDCASSFAIDGVTTPTCSTNNGVCKCIADHYMTGESTDCTRKSVVFTYFSISFVSLRFTPGIGNVGDICGHSIV